MPEAGSIEWSSIFKFNNEFIFYAIFYGATVAFFFGTINALFIKKFKKAFLLLGLIFLILPSWAAIIFTAYYLIRHHDGYVFLIFAYSWIGILMNSISSINLIIYFFLKRRPHTA